MSLIPISLIRPRLTSIAWRSNRIGLGKHSAAGRGLAALFAVALTVTFAPASASAAFPGEPGPIAFQSTRAGGLSIWLVQPDGGGLRQFTFGGGGARKPRAFQYAPSISPDGRRLAYVGAATRKGRTYSNLFVKGIGVRGVNNPGRPILRRPMSRPVESVAFDGSGRRLVFSAVPSGGGDFELFSVRIGGGGLKRLTRNRIQDIEPSVSRRGMVVFTRLFDRGRPPLALFGRSNLALIRPGSRAVRPLTHGRSENRDPDFAPAGSRVVYEHYSRGGSGAGRIDEIVLRSHRSHTVFRGARRESTFDDPHSPAFSPAGGDLVFDRTVRDEFGQIVNPTLFVLDGGGLRAVLDSNGEYDTEPSWGPKPRR
jgi:Tol biopolymer transport system component